MRSHAPRPLSTRLTTSLLVWYRRARRDLPWRRTGDPYAIWVSETMLQQTRVDTVLPYYERFLRELPDVSSLAEASEERRPLPLEWARVLPARTYAARGRARRSRASTAGGCPRSPRSLRGSRGWARTPRAPSPASRSASASALVDGNVARVLARLFAIREDVKGSAGAARVWGGRRRLVAEVDGPAGDWNQALMELGATVCTPREPRVRGVPGGGRLRGEGARHRGGPAADLAPKRKPVAVAARGARVGVAVAVRAGPAAQGALFGGLWEPPARGRQSIRARLARRSWACDAAAPPVGRARSFMFCRIAACRSTCSPRPSAGGGDGRARARVRRHRGRALGRAGARAALHAGRKVLSAAGALPLAKRPGQRFTLAGQVSASSIRLHPAR